MSRIGWLCCLVLGLPGMTGCATLVAPTQNILSVYSNPPSAEIRVNGVVQASTPADIALSKDGREVVEVSLPGFRTYPCPTHLRVGTRYVVADSLLCLFLFPLGCISFIDAGGAWDVLESKTCSANLQPMYFGGQPSGYPHSAPPEAWGGYQQGAVPQSAQPIHPGTYPAPQPQAAPAYPTNYPAPQPPQSAPGSSPGYQPLPPPPPIPAP